MVLAGDGVRSAIKPAYAGQGIQYGKFEDVEVIYNGEICGIIEMKMKHYYDPPFLPSWKPYYSTIRMTVFKDQPYILFDYGVFNESKTETSSDGTLPIERMFLEVNLDTENATNDLQYIFGADQAYTGTLSPGGDHTLLQNGEETVHPTGSEQKIGVTYTFNWTDGEIVNPLTGEKSEGWFGIFDEGEEPRLDHQVYAGIPNIHLQFPASLHVTRSSSPGDETTLHLEFVPGDTPAVTGIEAALPYSSRISYHNVFLFFAANEGSQVFDESYTGLFEDPPFIRFDESYYADTGVYGPLIPESDFSDPGKPPVESEMVDLFAYYQEQFVKGRIVGEDHVDGILKIGLDKDSNKKGMGKEYWGEYRITDQRNQITGNEYEFGSVFARLGHILDADENSDREKYYRAAFREGQYLLDRLFHWTPYEDVRQYNEEVWLPRGIPHHHSEGVHSTGYDSGHCQGVPMLDWYYGNTGDPDAFDMLTSFADGICLTEAEKFKSIDQYQMGGLERHLAWPLYTLVQTYRATGDLYYILNAKTIVDRADSFLINCPQCEYLYCYGRLIKTDGDGNGIPPGHGHSDDKNFKYAPVLGGQTFTTAILNQAVAKYYETTGESSAAEQSEKVGLFLKSLYVDDARRFYSDSYHTGMHETAIVNLTLVSPALKYIGLELDNSDLRHFADQLIQDYNDDDSRIPPTGEMKQQGQITNFVIDFMKYYEK